MEPEEKLANAVIIFAIKDYVMAAQTLQRFASSNGYPPLQAHGGGMTTCAKKILLYEDCKSFFESGEAGRYTRADTDMIFREVQRRNNINVEVIEKFIEHYKDKLKKGEKMTLYELTGNYKKLSEMMDDPEIDEQALADTMEAVQGEYDDKVANYGRVILIKNAEIDSLDKEIKRLQSKKETVKKNVTKLKGAVYLSMKETGRTKAGDSITSIRIRKNGGKLPLIFNEGVEVPTEFTKTTIETDNDKVREALDEGKVLSFAHYGERGESITIK